MADTTTTVELLLKARDEATGAIDHLSESLGRMHDHLLRIRDIAMGNILGNIAMSGIDELSRGIADFGKGLVTANADAESMHQTLQALYGTKTEADQAFDWMTKFALQAPFTRTSIIQAGVAIASFGGDITQVLPALGNVAAIMGQTMPVAAQAFNDALAGRFQMMNRDLHISKESLVQFGMEMDKSGHITNIQSFVTAFERLAAARFGDGMSLQMRTLNGQMSNLEDQFQNLQRTMGASVFGAVKGQLFDLITFLNTHQNQVSEFATIVGASLASAARAFFAFAQVAVSAIVPAVNVIGKAWTVLSAVTSAVFDVVGKVIGGFASWFSGTALPVIELAIGAIAEWWASSGTKIEAALGNIWNSVKQFGGLLVKGLQDVWNYASADIKFFWDMVSNLFTLGQDAISGNWSAFGTDFLNGIKQLAADAVNLFAAGLTGIVDLVTRIAYSVMEAMVPVANNLMGPITWVAQHFRDAFKEMGGFIADFAGVAAAVGAQFATPFVVGMNTMIDAIKKANSMLPGFAQSGAIQKMHDLSMPNPGQTGASAQAATLAWFNKNAPGLDKGQSYAPKNSTAQAQAAMEADRKSLITPFDDYVNQLSAKIAGMLDPSAPHSTKAKADATKLGKEIVTNLFSGFGGLTGGLTMNDILKKMGISTVPGGQSFGSLPGAGGLPVAGFGTAVGTGGATSGTSGSSVGATKVPTGRVPLGALGATFMQTLATTGKLGGGTDPATRAAQQQVDGQQTQISQGDKHTQLMQATNDVLNEVRAAVVDTRNFLARLAGPTHTPGNPLTARGVGRPSF